MALMPLNCWKMKRSTPILAARLDSTSLHDDSPAPPPASLSLPARQVGGCMGRWTGGQVRHRSPVAARQARKCAWQCAAGTAIGSSPHTRALPASPAPSCAAAACSPHSFSATSVASRRMPLSTSQVGDSGQISMPARQGTGVESVNSSHCSTKHSLRAVPPTLMQVHMRHRQQQSPPALPSAHAAALTQSKQRSGCSGQRKHQTPAGSWQRHIDQ